MNLYWNCATRESNVVDISCSFCTLSFHVTYMFYAGHAQLFHGPSVTSMKRYFSRFSEMIVIVYSSLPAAFLWLSPVMCVTATIAAWTRPFAFTQFLYNCCKTRITRCPDRINVMLWKFFQVDIGSCPKSNLHNQRSGSNLRLHVMGIRFFLQCQNANVVRVLSRGETESTIYFQTLVSYRPLYCFLSCRHSLNTRNTKLKQASSMWLHLPQSELLLIVRYSLWFIYQGSYCMLFGQIDTSHV